VAEDIEPAATVPASDDDPAAAELADHHRHHHGGFVMFIAMSLSSLGTTPDQESAITKVRSDLRAKMQPAQDAEKALLSILADGVAAGTLDPTKVEAAVAHVSAASADVAAATADALNQLHAVLTAPQRAAVADKLEAHMQVWRSANADAEGPSGTGQAGGRLATVAQSIGLTPDQVDKVRKSFDSTMNLAGSRPDSGEAETYVKSFGAAFASDAFDAHGLTNNSGAENGRIAGSGATAMARFYEALTPVLTPDQRTKVAATLRSHASRDDAATGT
jgi:Spy/CpxP family protein refolding chaperone